MRMACPIGPGLMLHSSKSLRIFYVVTPAGRRKAAEVPPMLGDSAAQ